MVQRNIKSVPHNRTKKEDKVLKKWDEKVRQQRGGICQKRVVTDRTGRKRMGQLQPGLIQIKLSKNKKFQYAIEII